MGDSQQKVKTSARNLFFVKYISNLS